MMQLLACEQPLAAPGSIVDWRERSLESVDFFAAPRDHCLGLTLLRQLIEGVWADFRRIPFTNP